MVSGTHVTSFMKDTVVTIAPDALVVDAARKMRDHRIGSVVVAEDGEVCVGILTERDIISKAVSLGLDCAAVRVHEIMTSQLIFATVDDTMEQAQNMMAQNNIRHLPILSDGKAVGMISSRDAMGYQLNVAYAEIRRSAKLLGDLETRHPGISQIQMDSHGRVVFD